MAGLMNEIMDIIDRAGIKREYEKVLGMNEDLDDDLLKMYKSYWADKNNYYLKCESTAQRLVMLILKEDDLREIHSARYRVKSVDSLIVKYITKKALLSKKEGEESDIEKYRPMDGSNYHMVITDLIGIRILIRYKQQLEMVHKWIWDTFYKPNKPYIKDWLKDYPKSNTEDFIVEQPKLYYRDSNESTTYNDFGKDIFDQRESDYGYSSIHYVVFFDGKYAEIQVRTVFDEAWSECTHDLAYKFWDNRKKAEFKQLSDCLAAETQAAEKLAGFMYEKSKAAKAAAEKRRQGAKQTGSSVMPKRTVEFSGDIDKMLL